MGEFDIIIDKRTIIDLAKEKFTNNDHINLLVAKEILRHLSADRHFTNLIDFYIKDHFDEYVKILEDEHNDDLANEKDYE